MNRSGRGRAGARSATALGLAAAATLVSAGAAPAPVRAQDVHEVALRAEPTGWIGVSIDIPVRAGSSDDTPDGLLVSRVMEDSPADVARLRPGDRIVRVNGLVATVGRFKEIAGKLRPGDRIQLTYEAEGARTTVTITAAERPDDPVHFLPREMVVRISSKVDSLRFYTVRSIEAGSIASQDVRIRVGGNGGAARAVTSGGDVRRTVAVEPRGESGRPAPPDRESVRILLGGEEITTWFDAIQEPDSIRARLFDVRAEGTQLRTPPLRALDPPVPATRATALRIRGMRSAGVEPGPSTSVFTLVEQRDLVAGARLSRVGPDLATYFDVEGGLLVTEVIEGTPSTEAGLQPGDVLVEVDERPLEEIEQFRRAWASAAHEKRTLTLTLVRRGERMELRLPG